MRIISHSVTMAGRYKTVRLAVREDTG